MREESGVVGEFGTKEDAYRNPCSDALNGSEDVDTLPVLDVRSPVFGEAVVDLVHDGAGH